MGLAESRTRVQIYLPIVAANVSPDRFDVREITRLDQIAEIIAVDIHGAPKFGIQRPPYGKDGKEAFGHCGFMLSLLGNGHQF